jgi:hypothetical protein
MRSDDVARTIQSLETAILDRAGRAIAEEIDFDILTQLLTENGWTSVRVNYGGAQSWSRVTEWVDQYFKGRYYEHAGHWAIEQAEDLTLFLLKWQVR